MNNPWFDGDGDLKNITDFVVCPQGCTCKEDCEHKQPHSTLLNCSTVLCKGRPVGPCAETLWVWVYEEKPA